MTPTHITQSFSAPVLEAFFNLAKDLFGDYGYSQKFSRPRTEPLDDPSRNPGYIELTGYSTLEDGDIDVEEACFIQTIELNNPDETEDTYGSRTYAIRFVTRTQNGGDTYAIYMAFHRLVLKHFPNSIIDLTHTDASPKTSECVILIFPSKDMLF